MTKAEAAQEAIAIVLEFDREPHGTPLATMIQRALLYAVAAEREKCAKLADGLRYRPCNPGVDACKAAEIIGKHIRARGDS